MIRTTEGVSINSGLNETVNVILHGKIMEALWKEDFTKLLVIGKYFYYDDGEVLVKHFNRELQESEINLLYEDLVPLVNESKTVTEKNIFDDAFILLMAQEYSLSPLILEKYYE